MRKPIMKIILIALAVVGLALAARGENWMDRKTPFYYSAHITTNTTTTVTSATAYLSTLQITCTAAGTTETIKVQTKESTPKVLYQSGTLTTGNVVTLPVDIPFIMVSGIDIITGGSAPATVDVWITYWQQ